MEMGSQPFNMWAHSIFLAYRGSYALGTNEIDSDYDLIGVVLPPLNYFFGLSEFDQYEKSEDNIDIVSYGFKKYINLLVKGNPNLIETLYMPDDLIIIDSPMHKFIRNTLRQKFITTNTISAFIGYAENMFNKMQRGVTRDMGQKRKVLFEKYGYDTKDAMHLIRLLRQTHELLLTNRMTIKRKDAAELLEIKHGSLSLEQIKEEASKLIEQIRTAEKVRIDIRSVVDKKKVEEEIVELLSSHFWYKKIERFKLK